LIQDKQASNVAARESFAAWSRELLSLDKSTVPRREQVLTCEHDAGAAAMALKSYCIVARNPAAMAALRVSAEPFF